MELKEAMKLRNITAKELSRLTGIGISTINKYSCKNRKISIENAKKIAEILRMDWWELFDN